MKNDSSRRMFVVMPYRIRTKTTHTKKYRERDLIKDSIVYNHPLYQKKREFWEDCCDACVVDLVKWDSFLYCFKIAC